MAYQPSWVIIKLKPYLTKNSSGTIKRPIAKWGNKKVHTERQMVQKKNTVK